MKIIYLIHLALVIPMLAWGNPYPVTPALTEKIYQQMAISGEYPRLAYPNENPESLYANSTDGKVVIFAYGSLMNKESAQRTLSEAALKTLKPSLAFGVQRVFDRKVSTTGRWGEVSRPNDIGMLNIYPTGNIKETANGVAFEVSLEDLKALINREEGYDLIPVVIVMWDDLKSTPDNAVVMIGYTFAASTAPRQGVYYTSNSVNPVPGYALASLQGASYFGLNYMKMWIESTYLADRTTLFSEWLANPYINCTDSMCE